MKKFFSQTIIKLILKYMLYMFIALLVQNMLFSQLRIFGVCPMILPAVAVAAGMFAGPTGGTVFALIMGIFADMAYVENTVLFTILFPMLAFGADLVVRYYVNKRFFAFMGLSLAASLITALAQMLLTFAGDAWSSSLIVTALLQTILSLPVSALAFFAPARWAAA